MTLSEYLGSYMGVKRAYWAEKRLYEAFKDYAHYDYFHDPRFEDDFERVEERLHKLSRLYDRYAMRMWSALDRVHSPTQRRVLTMFYMYNLTYEEIADKEFVGWRQVGRILEGGRPALKKALLEVMPKSVRITGRKYRRKK